MRIRVLEEYTSNNVKNHLSSQSGQYLKADGTPVSASDLITLEQLLKDVVNGATSSVSPLYVAKNQLNKKGDEAPDNVKFFDHFVIEDVNSNIDENGLIDAVKKSLNLTAFNLINKGNGKWNNNLIAGERQAFTRIEYSPNGNKHLHILMARRSVATSDDLKNALEKAKNNTEYNNETKAKAVEYIQNALHQQLITGKDKSLTSTFDLSETYFIKEFMNALNENLNQAGIAPIEDFIMKGSTGTNRKTITEAKQDTNEIANSGFSEETVSEIIENIQKSDFSTIDSLIIQKRIEENKRFIEERTNEMHKVASETRMLIEAQEAISSRNVLSNEVANLKTALESKDSTIQELKSAIQNKEEEKQTAIKEVEESLKEQISEIETKHALEIQGKQSLIEEIQEKFDSLNEEFETIESEVSSLQTELERKETLVRLKENRIVAKDGELAAKEIVIADKDSIIGKYKKALEDKEFLIKEQEATAERQRKQIEELKAQLEAQTKEVKEAKQEAQEAKKEATEQQDKTKEIERTLSDEIKSLKASNAETMEEVNQLKSVNRKLLETMTSFKTLAENISKTYAKAITAVKAKIKNNATVKKVIEPEFTKLNTEVKAFEEQKKALTEAEKNLQNFFNPNKKEEPKAPAPTTPKNKM